MTPRIKRSGLPAISLSADTSVITSIANDTDYTEIFARQIDALATDVDVAIAFSTSGKSQNCVKALELAKLKGLKSISFTKKNSNMAELTDICLAVPSDNTQHIQECHIFAYHVIVEMVELSMIKED